MRSTNVGGALSDTSGEYDAMGRNVVDPGPYITLNTELPTDQNDGRIDLGGSAEGYRPGRAQYQIDGLAVSEREFMMEINSGRIGGMFGLFETAVRMSSRITSVELVGFRVGKRRFPATVDGANRAINEQLEEGKEIFARYSVGYSWSLSFLVLPQTNTPLGGKAKERAEKATEGLKIWLPTKSCQENVIDKLKPLGFNLSNFIKFLKRGYEIYDLARARVPVIGNLFTEAEATRRNLTADDTVYGTYYRDTVEERLVEGRVVKLTSRTNAVTSISSPTFKVYLRSSALTDDVNRNYALMFHEALHGFLTTARTDPDLQRAFGQSESESINITDHIKKHCFTATQTR